MESLETNQMEPLEMYSILNKKIKCKCNLCKKNGELNLRKQMM